MFIFGGDAQTAQVNTAVPIPPSVKVADAGERPVAGVAITFTPAPGNGVAAPVVVNTDANGVAALTSWTLGAVVGAESMVASSPGIAPVTFHATATAPGGGALAIVAQPVLVTNDVVFAQQPQVKLVNGGVDLHLAGDHRDGNRGVRWCSNHPQLPETAADVDAGVGTRADASAPVYSGNSVRAPVGRGGGRGPGRNDVLTVTAGATAITDANGVATFVGMKVTGTVQAFQLSFTANGPAFGPVNVTSANITAVAGVGTSMIKLSGDRISALVGVPMSIPPTVQLVDVSGNPTSLPAATSVTFTPDPEAGSSHIADCHRREWPERQHRGRYQEWVEIIA